MHARHIIAVDPEMAMICACPVQCHVTRPINGTMHASSRWKGTTDRRQHA